MYPNRQSVERLEEDAGQDQALLAARGRVDADHLSAEERPVSDEEEADDKD